MNWDDEAVERLRQMWDHDGLTGSEIVHAFGGILTRNAVIGKVHRLRLNKRPHGGGRALRATPYVRPPRVSVPRIRSVRAETAKPVSQTLPKPKPIPVPAIWQGPSVSFASRAGRQCCFPVSGEPGPDMQCCGAPAVRLRYCAHHYRIVYVPHRPNLKAVRPAFRNYGGAA